MHADVWFLVNGITLNAQSIPYAGPALTNSNRGMGGEL